MSAFLITDLSLVANSLAIDLAAVTPAIPPPITAILGGGGPPSRRSLSCMSLALSFVEELSAPEVVAVTSLLRHPKEKALAGATDGPAACGMGTAWEREVQIVPAAAAADLERNGVLVVRKPAVEWNNTLASALPSAVEAAIAPSQVNGKKCICICCRVPSSGDVMVDEVCLGFVAIVVAVRFWIAAVRNDDILQLWEQTKQCCNVTLLLLVRK